MSANPLAVERATNEMNRQNIVLGVEYCTGYVDEDGQWRKGFYCPKNADSGATLEKSKDIFCCGTQVSKFCCERKEGFTTSSTSGFYVSFSTLVSVTTVTFILAVLLTALAFICCKRYWKDRVRNVEIHETHFYRMACSSSNAPLVSPPFSASFHSNATASFASPFANQPTSTLLDVFQPYSLTLPHRRSATGSHDATSNGITTISVIEPPEYTCPPPPPYQSHTSLVQLSDSNTDVSNANSCNTANNNTNTNSVAIMASQPKPSNQKPPKPFWRKLSQ